MPASERTRGSCSCRVEDGVHYISRERKILGITILLIVLLAVLALLGTAIASARSTTTAVHKLALKARMTTITTVVHATTTVIHTPTLTQSNAVVSVSTTIIHTPTPTHASAVALSKLGLGVIVGICFAVIGGILLASILLCCVARCLAKRINRSIGARGHPAGNSCDEHYSASARSARGQSSGNYSLRDLSGGDHSIGGHSGEDKFAGHHPPERQLG
jgi:hypothetical protein